MKSAARRGSVYTIKKRKNKSKSKSKSKHTLSIKQRNKKGGADTIKCILRTKLELFQKYDDLFNSTQGFSESKISYSDFPTGNELGRLSKYSDHFFVYDEDYRLYLYAKKNNIVTKKPISDCEKLYSEVFKEHIKGNPNSVFSRGKGPDIKLSINQEGKIIMKDLPQYISDEYVKLFVKKQDTDDTDTNARINAFISKIDKDELESLLYQFLLYTGEIANKKIEISSEEVKKLFSLDFIFLFISYCNTQLDFIIDKRADHKQKLQEKIDKFYKDFDITNFTTYVSNDLETEIYSNDYEQNFNALIKELSKNNSEDLKNNGNLQDQTKEIVNSGTRNGTGSNKNGNSNSSRTRFKNIGADILGAGADVLNNFFGPYSH